MNDPLLLFLSPGIFVCIFYIIIVCPPLLALSTFFSCVSSSLSSQKLRLLTRSHYLVILYMHLSNSYFHLFLSFSFPLPPWYTTFPSFINAPVVLFHQGDPSLFPIPLTHMYSVGAFFPFGGHLPTCLPQGQETACILLFPVSLPD